MKKKYLFFIFFIFVKFIYAQDTSSIYNFSDYNLLKEKCSTCHSLNRIFNKEKLKPWEWDRIVMWMKDRIDGVISDNEAKKIIEYLSTDRYLFEFKCSKCHALDRIIKKTDSYNNWIKIIKSLHEKDAAWIKENEIERIAQYLNMFLNIERKKLMQNMYKNLIFLEENFDTLNLTELFHNAESLQVCVDGLCKFPPLDESKEFGKFVNKLNELTNDLKKNFKSNEVKLSRENLSKIRKLCGECHGSVRK